MKRKAPQKSKAESGNHGGRFAPVFNSRKQKLRGLVERNGRYYAQMRLADPSGKSKAVRIPLDSTRLDHAIAEAEKKRTEKREGEIHLPGARPSFEKLVELYKISADFTAKKKGTQENETQALNRWIEHLGGKRIDWIRKGDLTAYRNKRKADGVSNRTINLDMTAFNNSMKYATNHNEDWIKDTPRLKKLEESNPPERPRLYPEQIKLLLEKADVTQNAALMRFYIRFLAASGCREQEALKIRKADVDMELERVTVGADGDTKSGESRKIEFNPTLKKVLADILRSLPPSCTWLFPSPQRGKKDIHARSLRESFYQIRKEAGLPWVGFHDLRRYFASQCVMQNIDAMTVSQWLGHQDGGKLVSEVYADVYEEHKRKAAAKLKL
jgi:integrase